MNLQSKIILSIIITALLITIFVPISYFVGVMIIVMLGGPTEVMSMSAYTYKAGIIILILLALFITYFIYSNNSKTKKDKSIIEVPNTDDTKKQTEESPLSQENPTNETEESIGNYNNVMFYVIGGAVVFALLLSILN